MTAEWAVHSAVHSLNYFLLEKGAPLKCKGKFESTVKKLRSDLNELQRLILDGERNRGPDLENDKRKAKELAHTIEDAVEYYAGPRFSRQYLPYRRSFPVDSYSEKILQLSDQFREHSLGTSVEEVIRREDTAPPVGHEPNSFIGLVDDRNYIRDLLVGPDNLSVVTIVGMGGSGKTTLAKFLYNDSETKPNFEVLSWIRVTHLYEKGRLLRGLVLSLPDCEVPISRMGAEEDHFKWFIYAYLVYKRYLIVIDDVWSNKVWDYLKDALPDNRNGSRVIVTTRRKNVAIHISTDERCIHHMKPLTEKGSWELFKMTIRVEIKDQFIDKPTVQENVKKYLLNPSPENLSVAAIYGEAGSGKTTIAKRLYEDSDVGREFSKCCSINVGQPGELTDIWRQFADGLGLSDRAAIATEKNERMDMIHRIYKELSSLKYLIVLDDVCSTDIWDNIKYALPNNSKGSRVLITTAKLDLATEVAPEHTHSMPQLSAEQNNTDFNDPLRLMRVKQIVSNCDGLPLAIVSAATKMKSNPSETSDMLASNLASSYDRLPFFLKQCFVYLGQFPIGEGVPFEKLYLLWTAEGMITQDKEFTRRDVAKDYLNQLIEQDMVAEVESDHVSPSIRFASYKLSLSMHKGLQKVIREDFGKVLDDKDGNNERDSTRRLAIHFNKWKGTLPLSDTCKAIRIRSILIFDEADMEQKRFEEPIDLQEFQFTRVLDFNGVNFKHFPLGMEKLMYLKYLSFQGCCLKKLPSFVRNFPLLETLDLGVKDSLVIPNVLRELLRLRHLYFPQAYQSATGEKLKLDKLKYLEILENFRSAICNSDDLKGMRKLQSLTSIVDGNETCLENVIRAMKKIDQRYLHHTSLVVKGFDSSSEDRLKIVEMVFQCESIHSLDIEGYLSKLSLQRIGKNFTKIVLNGSEFSGEIMLKLGKLPNLKSLVLKNDAFVGKEMVFSCGSFPELINLHLEHVQLLEKLQVEEKALPKLHTLTIKRCNKLKELPREWIEKKTPKVIIEPMTEEFQSYVERINRSRKDKLIV